LIEVDLFHDLNQIDWNTLSVPFRHLFEVSRFPFRSSLHIYYSYTFWS
jgi:hypothetical protein